MDAEETHADLELAAVLAEREAAFFMEKQRLKQQAENFNRQLALSQAA